MKVYTARQAILNRKNNVAAYELFFRNNEKNTFPSGINGHEATSKLLGRTYFNKGIKPFTAGKRALINFSEESLIKRLPFLLPKNEILIEILESVTPSDEVFNVCAELAAAGYSLALDDFIYKPQWKRFLTIVRLVKFDIQQTPLDSITHLINELKTKTNIKLLAEKIETHQEHEHAMQLGFHLFQGFYYHQPEMQHSEEIESTGLLLTLLFREVNKPYINHKKIINLLERDCNLIFKLLCFVNSGIFPIKGKISSVKQAINYMGESQLKELISLFFTAVLSQDKPPELLKTSATRAKFCELVILQLEPIHYDSAFMTGMFSLIDAVLDIPMHDIATRLSLDDYICEALLDDNNTSQSKLSMALRAIKYLERGSWYQAEREALKLSISIDDMNLYYQTAIQWAECLNDCELITLD